MEGEDGELMDEEEEEEEEMLWESEGVGRRRRGMETK